jgi:DNA-binding transcriptional ArsR family regulator
MEILGKILGSPARVKIMRLFLLNKDKHFIGGEVAQKSQVKPETARRELKLLSSVGFIKKRSNNWFFNPLFKYEKEFEALLVRSDILNTQNVVLDNLKRVGQIKLVIISGIFIKSPGSRVDLLIVGDKAKKSKIEKGIKKIEAEIGAELVYAIFDTKEFIYRLNMYDKLIRDILDYPHEVIWETKELSTQALKKVQELL